VEQQGLTERELRAWRTFTEMQAQLMARIEQQLQASSGMSSADYAVLALLSEAPDGRLRPYELARMAAWAKSRLHHQLTRMSARGLITRERYGSRGIYAGITPQGLAALKEAVPGHTQEVRRLFTDRLTSEQLEQLAGIATAILDHLKADQPSGEGEAAPSTRTLDAAG
jgi:DNA-binding MarR family transcriptional regulator